MTKLIKPVMIDNIIRSGVVLKSRKAYKEISKFVLITFIKNVDDLAAITNMYDYIRMQNITIKIDTILFTVADISMCKLCFLNANNYLNVLKYIKHNKNKFPLTSTL